MCRHCATKQIDRRSMLRLTGFGLGAAALGITPVLAADAPARRLTPEQALAALKEGNARYVDNAQVCVAELSKSRAGVAASQAPWATIVGCADSRVPPELLFGGLGLGQLFVARNAGNLVDTATMGTVEYGAEHLGAPLVVVLGHQRCGAVAAACEVVTKHATFHGSIGPMVKPIIPAAVAVKEQPGDFVDNTVRESAKRTAKKLETASPILSHLVADGKLKVIAARYCLDDGKVEFLA